MVKYEIKVDGTERSIIRWIQIEVWVGFFCNERNVKIREMLGLQSVNLAIKRCTLGRFHAWNIT